MKAEDVTLSIRKEMNRRRRYGGAEDVSTLLWENGTVQQTLERVVQHAQRDGFTGDWDYASAEMEEQMEALARALRKASSQLELPAHVRRPMLATHHNQELSPERAAGNRGSQSSLPNVVRQDSGGRALADYLTWYWQNDGYAEYYFRVICGGEYLTREEAWKFLTSPLPKVLGDEDYQKLGLCPARTTGRILSKYLKDKGTMHFVEMLMTDPKTGQSIPPVNTLYDEVGNYCVEINLPPPHVSGERVKRLVLNLNESQAHFVGCRYTLPRPYTVEDGRDREIHISVQPAPFFQGEEWYVEGYYASVMSEMISMAEFLCSFYGVSIWDMLEAFLTGRFPPQPAIEIFSNSIRVERVDGPDEVISKRRNKAFSAQGPLSLTVQPWVTPEVLADAWREYRKGTASYSPSEKQADALQFVLSHTPPGEAFAWERLARQWQEERGELMTRGQLLKQFQRARAAILPGYEEQSAGWV